MKSRIRLTILAGAIFGFSFHGVAMSMEVVNNDNFNMNVGARLQEVAYGELVHDPYKDNARVYLFLKQARLRIDGRVNGIKYDWQWVGAAEDINGSNNGLTLLDASFDVPLFNWESSWLKVGQFKVNYGRESLTEEGEFQLVDRSFNGLGFGLGRDVGAVIHGYRGKAAGSLGVFTGGSRDVPLRFLPEHLGMPMVTARIGYNDGLDKDIFTVSQNDLTPTRTTKATYLSGMYMKDTRIGHSTVLNSRTAEKTLLMNTNWNSFLNRGASPGGGSPGIPASAGSSAGPNTMDRGTLWQVGWDAAIRGPVGSYAWNAEAEINYADYENKYGSLHLNGGRVQGGLLMGKFEAALRYSLMTLDRDMKFGIANGKPMQEVAPAFSYYIRGHKHKIVLDFPVLINAPVFIENNYGNQAGAYVGIEQPDQISVVAANGGRVEYQTVPQARLMYQLAF